MGCHTWFYRKLNPQPTYDEVKDYVVNQLLKGVDLYKKMINNELEKDIVEVFPEWTKEYGEKHLSIILRQHRMIEKGLCQKAVCNRYKGFDMMTHYLNGVFYISDDSLPHDLFRIHDYPKDILYSLEETLSFIDNNKDKVSSFTDENKKRLIDFWSKNPDGFIWFS